MSDSTDDVQNDLIEHALAGDESALAALFDRYRDRLGRMIRPLRSEAVGAMLDDTIFPADPFAHSPTYLASPVRPDPSQRNRPTKPG